MICERERGGPLSTLNIRMAISCCLCNLFGAAQASESAHGTLHAVALAAAQARCGGDFLFLRSAGGCARFSPQIFPLFPLRKHKRANTHTGQASCAPFPLTARSIRSLSRARQLDGTMNFAKTSYRRSVNITAFRQPRACLSR